MKKTAKRVSSCQEVAEALGIWSPRTLESAKQEVLDFYKEYGCRPHNRDLIALSGWLSYHYNLSVANLCDEMGFSGGRVDRSMGFAKQEIQEFFKEYGRRPTAKDLGSLNQWLSSHQGTTLSKLCDELGIDERRNYHRDMESAKQEVLAFYEEHGRCPTSATHSALNAWLLKQGVTLPQLCAEMGISKKRTLTSVKNEILKWYARHGRRPTSGSLGAWCRDKGTTLSRLCDDLALPVERVRNRTLNSAKQEILKFYNKHGRRPHQRDLGALNTWLAKHNSSVAKVCNDLDLPGYRILERDLKSVKHEIRAFYKRCGYRPTQTDLSALNHWLRRNQESSLAMLCDEMGLPRKKRV